MQDNHLKKKIIVSGIWFIYFCFGFSVASLSPLVHHITIDLSISYKKMGIILGSWQFVYVLFAIPAGYILDKIAFKNTLFIAAIIMSLSLIFRSLSENFNHEIELAFKTDYLIDREQINALIFDYLIMMVREQQYEQTWCA